MRRNQEHPWKRQCVVVFIKSFVKLNELNHKAVVGTRDAPLLLDKVLRFLVVISELENYIGDYDGD